MNKYNKLINFLFLSSLAFFSFSSAATQASLKQVIKSVEDKAQPFAGYSFYVINNEQSFSVNNGAANPKGDAISSTHLFRIASVTKTFTAATVLRLVEEGKLSLNAPISSLISKPYNALLVADGYATKQITVKHLLSHTAGLFDHAQSENYFNAISANTEKHWTVAEQIQGAINWGDPLSKPGEKFAYSDTGYLLLGDIIERASDLSLPIAVRTYLKFEENGLQDVVWEQGDIVAIPQERRVHQYFNNNDTYHWNPSLDLYGGGGLVASTKSMATFFQQLFNHQIFNTPKTLERMLQNDDLPAESPYRLGIFEKDYGGLTIFEHSGFWGTLVIYSPETNTYIAGALVKQSDYKTMVEVMSTYLISLNET